MKKLTYAEFAAPDERTQRFTPYGLSTGTRILTPESSAEFQQACIAVADLDPGVPNSTRTGFERLRLVHSYGVLCYELFTITADLTWVVLEHAVRERFVAYYYGQIPIIHQSGQVSVLKASNFQVISDAFRRGGSHSKGWKLDIAPEPPIAMPLTLDPLLRWAQLSGLLGGQRNRRVQLAVYADLRNHFAHGASVERLGMPPDSARSIRDLAEVINRLWGKRTPGGRLYPSPIARRPVVLAWTNGWGKGTPGSMFTQFELHHLPSETGHGLTCMVVLAPEAEQDLAEFDARYELTPLPTTWLFGPSSFDEALAWLSHQPDLGDEVDPIDRVFAVRVHDDKVFLPMRLELFKASPEPSRAGRWRLVQADYPNDAHFHARHQARDEECPEHRYGGCPVTELAEGTWDEMIAVVDRVVPGLAPGEFVAAAVPRRYPFPEDVGY